MAFSNDPPNSDGRSTAAFANARLTPEAAELLAATFRPSWEPDEAPFAGTPIRAPGDPRTFKTWETQADVRGPVLALNGTHAPAPATVLRDEPKSSVLIDEAVEAAPGPPPASPSLPAPADAGARVAKSGTLVLPSMPHHGVQARTLVMAASPRGAPTVRSTRPKASSLDLGQLEFANRSTPRLWIALGGAAGILLSAGVWIATSSADKARSAPAPTPSTTMATATSRIPPPPAETFAPPPPAAVSTAPPPAAPLPPPPPQAVTAPATPVVPAPARWVAPPPRPPTWTPTTVPARPAPPRPKAGQTIVRDVPF